MPEQGISFEDWLLEWKDEIVQAQEFTKSSLPTTGAEIQVDLNRTTREYPRMAELLADAKQHLIARRAAETLAIRRAPEFSELAAPERKVMVDARVAPIDRVVDVLKATVRALDQRSFALMNQRNYEGAALRMSGRGEG